MITTQELIRRIRQNTTTYNNIPNAEQISEFINLAMVDLANSAPHVLSVTIQVTSGQDTYTLPDDFHALKSFDVGAGGGYMIGATMYGSESTYSEIVKISGLTLTISPTPTSNQDRVLEYYARHIRVNDEFPYCEDRHVNAIMWRTLSYSCTAKMAEAERVAWIESTGENRVDKTGIFKAIAREKEFSDSEWQKAISLLSDPSSGTGSAYGRRSSYRINPYDVWERTSILDGGY